MEIFTFFRVVLIDINECVVLKSQFKIAPVIVSQHNQQMLLMDQQVQKCTCASQRFDVQ